jgi:hypothetical protein
MLRALLKQIGWLELMRVCIISSVMVIRMIKEGYSVRLLSHHNVQVSSGAASYDFLVGSIICKSSSKVYANELLRKFYDEKLLFLIIASSQLHHLAFNRFFYSIECPKNLFVES